VHHVVGLEEWWCFWGHPRTGAGGAVQAFADEHGPCHDDVCAYKRAPSVRIHECTGAIREWAQELTIAGVHVVLQIRLDREVDRRTLWWWDATFEGIRAGHAHVQPVLLV
jgi:hypothetical protein